MAGVVTTTDAHQLQEMNTNREDGDTPTISDAIYMLRVILGKYHFPTIADQVDVQTTDSVSLEIQLEDNSASYVTSGIDVTIIARNGNNP